MKKDQPGKNKPATKGKSDRNASSKTTPPKGATSEKTVKDANAPHIESGKKRPFWEAVAKKAPVKKVVEKETPASDPIRRKSTMAAGKPGPRPFERNKPRVAPPPPKPIQRDPNEPMRLSKFVAHCGISARRQAGEFVKQGLVTVNGEIEKNPAYMVQATDVVTFKGKPIKIEENLVYILMNKPKDVITTANDERGRKTVLDLIGDKVQERIFPVGRLDRLTTGLLLLTNDGELAKKLSHPSHKVQKVYHVTLNKILNRPDFESILKGIELEDGVAQVDSLHYAGERKNEVEIGLHSGKNRIVRRLFEHLGYEIEKLDRIYFAGLTKKDIGRGHFRHLTQKEVIMLKHFK